jgi:hypothetical protein
VTAGGYSDWFTAQRQAQPVAPPPPEPAAPPAQQAEPEPHPQLAVGYERAAERYDLAARLHGHPQPPDPREGAARAYLVTTDAGGYRAGQVVQLDPDGELYRSIGAGNLAPADPDRAHYRGTGN